MSADGLDDATIRRILQSVKSVALVGASAKPERAAHHVMEFWQHRGVRVFPVNPVLAGQTLLGERVFSSLSEIAAPIDLADIFRASEAAGEASDEAIARGIKTIWMQLGVINEPAAQRARAAGAVVVMDRCPKIECARLGV